ncbi:MAG: hypothetical protein RR665_02010 [Malacoplasma sp.]
MSNLNNKELIYEKNSTNKKWKKNKKIIFFTFLGLSTLTIAVSLPFGLLSNLITSQTPPITSPSLPYDTQTPLSKSNVDFDAYYVSGWKDLTLSDILEKINLQRDSSVLEKSISLKNLENLGIVPKNDNWKSWVSVRSVPMEGNPNSFRILIQESAVSKSQFSYDVNIPDGAIKASSYYNASNKLATNNNFYAYTPTTLKTLSDFYLTYLRDSSNQLTKITIQNLEKIGIVPILDQYQSWESITLFPLDGKTIKVSIKVDSSPSSIITYNISGITSSSFYNASIDPILTNDDFVAYTPNSFQETYLTDLNLEFIKNSYDPSEQIIFENLERVGIVPINNNYKSWESISIYPISGNKVKCIVRTSANASTFEYDIIGVKASTFYDVNSNPLHNTNPEFIMYTPYAWTKMFPADAAITLTSTSSNPKSKISLVTLNEIGIVPKNLEYKNWSSITITPISSGTCDIIIKKSSDSIPVANFNVSCFRTSGKYSKTNILHKSDSPFFKFIWYKPTAWDTMSPKDINISFTSSNITLESLEEIGIVPLSAEYKLWNSILKTDILYGLEGRFNVTMTSTNPVAAPITFDITDLKKSSYYDPTNIIRYYPNITNPDFIQFMPYKFNHSTQSDFDSLKKLVWTNNEITPERLETIGIVPINNAYSTWTKVEFGNKPESSNVIYFYIYNIANNPNAHTDIEYPFTLETGR